MTLQRTVIAGAIGLAGACGTGSGRADADPSGCVAGDCDASGDDGGSGDAPADDTYDFIVVGSGAGGGPLAANLARAGFTVLVLEAGLDVGDKDVYKVPAWHPLSTEDEEMSWQYFVEHYTDRELADKDEKYEHDEGGVFYPRAAALGGCTAHNAMITMVPHDSDWNRIADTFAGVQGADGWRADHMQSYYESVTSWLDVQMPDPQLAIGDFKLTAIVLSAALAFVDATSEDLGVDLDPTDIDEDIDELLALLGRNVNEHRADVGVYPFVLATRDGERNGTRERLLATADDFPLTIETGALVTNVVFADRGDEGDTPTVVGVEYYAQPHLYRADPLATDGPLPERKLVAFARREVILAAGAFNSPQLLKLSGIGPRSELEAHGIEVVVDLPGVGKNLQDRYEVPVIHEAMENINIIGEPEEKPFEILAGCTFDGSPDDACYREWKEQRTGVYTSNGGVMSLIMKSQDDLSDPDTFIFGVPGRFAGYELGYSKASQEIQNQFSWLVLKGHTHNRAGEVRLRSDDPRERPFIDFSYFGDPAGLDTVLGQPHQEDLDAIVRAVRLIRDIQGTADNLIAVNDENLAEIYPGEDVDTDQEIGDWVKVNAWGHHACCTNKMGSDDDPDAVLDHRLRVRGVAGLRVVDASIFPEIPGFFIVMPIYMASEHAADLILEDHGVTAEN